jgi:hypothetical protein
MSQVTLSIAQFEQPMRAAGYDEVIERVWPPDAVVDTHRHPFDVNALMIAGELTLMVPGEAPRLIRYHGVLAPNAKLRARVVPQGPEVAGPATEAAAAASEAEPVRARSQRMGWARLLKRVFDIDLQRCPRCGGRQVKIIAAILERAAIEKILTHLGLDPQPPPRGNAREAGHELAA